MAKLTAMCRTCGRLLRSPGWMLALAVLMTLPFSAAQAAAVLTMLEGEATLIIGDKAVAAAEGLQLPDLTLVRTQANTRLLRLEWPDGSLLDLGPDTQVMLAPTAFGPRDKRTPLSYLLKGWTKQTSPDKGPTSGLVAPRLDVQPFQGTVVSFVGAQEAWSFVESGGPVTLIERDGAAVRLVLKNGEVYARAAGAGKGATAPRPTPAEAQRVPRSFRDTLPRRAAAFKDRKVEPRALPAPSVADLRDWLAAEPALRKEFARRFAARAQDSAFRSELIRQFGDQPEWVPVLYPERLKAKP